MNATTPVCAQGKVQHSPDQRDRQDQDGDQDEERLAQARLLVVVGIRADVREPREEGIELAAQQNHAGARIR